MESTILRQNDAMAKLVPNFAKIMEDEAAKQNIRFQNVSKETSVAGAVSTGVLSIDLMMGGGHSPGTVSYLYGPTGSCKSTILYQTFRESMVKDLTVCFYDYESSTDPKYLEKMEFQLSDVIGFRNKKGTWDKIPKFWLTSGSTLEGAFKHMYLVMKALPNKLMLDDKDGGKPRWFLIQPDVTVRTNNWADLNKALKDKKAFEVEDGSPQLVFAIDSLAAMIPQAQEQDLERNDMAALARGLHRGFRWVKSQLGEKNCNLLVTNHVTVNPMAMFKDPETEPGGRAVEFYPDLKMRMEVKKTKKATVEEPHVKAGLDRYFMGTAFLKKNKKGPSYRSMDFRNWSDEAGNPGRGICPVFDLFQFLTSTNQVAFEGKGHKEFKVTTKGFEGDLHTWDTFKKFTLLDPAGKRLVDLCREQIKTGTAQEAYYDFLKDVSVTDKKKKLSMVSGSDKDVETEAAQEGFDNFADDEIDTSSISL